MSNLNNVQTRHNQMNPEERAWQRGRQRGLKKSRSIYDYDDDMQQSGKKIRLDHVLIADDGEDVVVIDGAVISNDGVVSLDDIDDDEEEQKYEDEDADDDRYDVGQRRWQELKRARDYDTPLPRKRMNIQRTASEEDDYEVEVVLEEEADVLRDDRRARSEFDVRADERRAGVISARREEAIRKAQSEFEALDYARQARARARREEAIMREQMHTLPVLPSYGTEAYLQRQQQRQASRTPVGGIRRTRRVAFYM
jgi:hypothetical protein